MKILDKIKDLRQNGNRLYAIGGNTPISDYNYCQEEFFEKDGKYYILGTGGAGSIYRVGNGTTAKGARIVIRVSKKHAEGRIKADKEGWTHQYDETNDKGDEYSHFFRYTRDGDIETMRIKHD